MKNPYLVISGGVGFLRVRSLAGSRGLHCSGLRDVEDKIDYTIALNQRVCVASDSLHAR